ncbi:MAG: SpaA isopeptide-forming pilin-related protein, partial [Eubacterium sp.]
LYPTVDGKWVQKDGKDIAYEAKSDIDGTVTFSKVDFGNYELVESTPKGYLTNQKIIITTTNLASAIDTNNQSFAYKVGETNAETAGVVYNKVNIKKINFTKQNQDGSVIKEAMTFDLSRQGSGGTWDGTNQKIKDLDITSNAGDYVPYGGKETGNPYQGITEDSQTGVFSLANIPNGNYKIEESKGPSNIQTGAEITIELEITDEAVKWRSYKGTIASGEWTPLTKEGDAYKFTATNDVKYGYMQLSKYHAELDSNGNKVVSTNKDQKIPVSGVTFNIYNNDGSDPNAYDSTDTSLGSVTTNEEGALNLPPDGKYGDKHLIYGETYWVVEQTKDGYTANSTAYKIKFESKSNHEQVAWLSEGKETPTYKKKNETVPSDYTGILNVPVATLVYKDSSKKYELSDQLSEAVKIKSGITVLTEKNAQGIKYLDNAKTLTLLYGQYEIKEIIAPNGYKVSSTPIEIKTKDFSAPVIKNLTDNQTSITFVKNDQNGKTAKEATFSLKGSFKSGSTPITWTSDGNPHVINNELIVGQTYTLTETGSAEAFQAPQNAEFTFKIADDGTIRELQTKNNSNVKATANEATLTMVNNRVYANAKLTKVDDSTAHRPISGAIFELHKTGYTTGTADRVIKSNLSTNAQGVINTSTLTGTYTDTDDVTRNFGQNSSHNGLTVGSYYFKETTTPASYKDGDNQNIAFTI